MNSSLSNRLSLAAIAALVLALVAKLSFTSLSSIITADWLATLFVFVAGLIVAFIAYTPDESHAVSENSRTLYVGNLPYRANETSVRELFSQHGQVFSVRLMKDRQTGKRRGFGFVEMAASDVDQAIEALNEAEFQERTLKVREAKDKTAIE